MTEPRRSHILNEYERQIQQLDKKLRILQVAICELQSVKQGRKVYAQRANILFLEDIKTIITKKQQEAEELHKERDELVSKLQRELEEEKTNTDSN
jgi:translation initiation factor 2 beta subunit (eIF-2beta)/eIF-5